MSTEQQVTVWMQLLNLNGMNPLVRVKIRCGVLEKEGLVAGFADKRPSASNVLYLKVRELEQDDMISDFENDPRCEKVSFAEITGVFVGK